MRCVIFRGSGFLSVRPTSTYFKQRYYFNYEFTLINVINER